MKKIDAAPFLVENGLLFAINTILHSLGLALEVVVEDDGTTKFGQLWDCRDDPEGILFSEESFNNGNEKFRKYMKEYGNESLKNRFNKLGFVIQTKK
jgi:hypothetical protein